MRVLAVSVTAIWCLAASPLLAGDMICTVESVPTPSAISPSTSAIEARAIFVTFNGYPNAIPRWADSFCTDVALFIETMSRGAQLMNLRVVRDPADTTKAWVAPIDTSVVLGFNRWTNVNGLVYGIIADSIDNVWDGVDYIFAIHYVPTLNCSNGSTVQTCYATNDRVGVDEFSTGVTGSTHILRPQDYNSVFNEATSSYLAVHEYGHNLGLEHSPGSGESGADFINLGRYDVMREVASGLYESGAVPYHPLQLVRLGWADDSTLAGVDLDTLRVVDVLEADGIVYRVDTEDSAESFYLANHQGTRRYDATYSGSGLLVWHVLRDANGEDISWDLESAVGKFTAGSPDAISGTDSLEVDSAYLGSGNDFFANGDSLSCGTNPSTGLYSGATQTSSQAVETSIAFENIRESSGDVLLEVFFTPRQRLTFPLAGDTAAVDLPNAITWGARTAACIDTVIGLLSDDNGSSFDTLFVDTTNTGSYSWTPSVIDSEYVVRLITHDKVGATGVSESGTFRVADRVAPSTVTNLLVEFVSQTIVGLSWTAPGDDSTSGTATEYDIRRSTSPITEGNWHLATKLTNEDPPSGAGEDELLAVSGLSSCTTYYFAIKTRDESHNWSALGTADGQGTTCGGGFAAAPVSEERAVEPTSVAAMPQDQLVLETTISDGTPSWTLTGYDNATLDEAHLLPGGIHVQVPDGQGGWQTRAHFATVGSDSLIGLKMPNRAATRLVFSGGFAVKYVAGRAVNRAGDVVEVDGVLSSRLGDLSEEVSADQGGSPDHKQGDTLTVSYTHTEFVQGEQVYLMVVGSIAGGAGETRGIRSNEPSLPTSFALEQNQPNPFSGTTTLRFDLPTSERVLLEVFDLQGRRLATLTKRRFEAGSHSVEWQPRSLGTRIQPGVYVYRLNAGGFTAQRKFVLLP